MYLPGCSNVPQVRQSRDTLFGDMPPTSLLAFDISLLGGMHLVKAIQACCKSERLKASLSLLTGHGLHHRQASLAGQEVANAY